MRHARDELAYGGHLLRVHQLGLNHRGIGNVGHEHYHAGDLATIVAHGTEVYGKFALRAIAAGDHQLQIVRLQAMQAGVEGFRKYFFVRSRDNPVQPISDQVILVKAARFIRALVGIADQTGSIRHHDQGLCVVEDLAGEIALALELRLEVLDLSDVEEDAAILQNLALAVLDHKGVFQRVDHGAVAAAQRDLKIANGTFFIELVGNLVALLGGDIDLGLQIELEDLFARLVIQHAHQRVIDFNEMAFRRSEEDAFLHVIEELAVALLGFAAVSDVFKHVDSLQAFIVRAVNARAGDQIVAVQHGMQI